MSGLVKGVLMILNDMPGSMELTGKISETVSAPFSGLSFSFQVSLQINTRFLEMELNFELY